MMGGERLLVGVTMVVVIGDEYYALQFLAPFFLFVSIQSIAIAVCRRRMIFLGDLFILICIIVI